jgi:hypothetical protein
VRTVFSTIGIVDIQVGDIICALVGMEKNAFLVWRQSSPKKKIIKIWILVYTAGNS